MSALTGHDTNSGDSRRYDHWLRDHAELHNTNRIRRGLYGKDRIHLNCSSGLDEPHQL